MFLGVQVFDFAQIQIRFRPNLTKFAQVQSILTKHFCYGIRLYPQLLRHETGAWLRFRSSFICQGT